MATDDLYDLVVIGSGPGGEKGAAQAAFFGKRVALIEAQDLLGGTCVHWGTLPSKSLRESAQHLSGLKMRGIAGLTTDRGQTGVRIEALMAHKRTVCARETERIIENMRRHKVEVIQARAEVTSPTTVRAHRPDGTHRDLETRFILVATGSHPFRPSSYDFSSPRIQDSDGILRIESVPSSLVVVGAGVIGSEYAAMFAALGVQVTLIEPRDALLPFLDEDVRAELETAFRKAGIDIRFNTKVEGATAPGNERVVATLEGGGTLESDLLLFAAGRTGNTAGLGLEALGVSVNKRGQIEVDEHYRTACPSIYAAGDVIGFPALASTSMEQARVGMCHAFDLKYKTQLAQHLPYGIYTIPEVSMVGATEQDLRAKGEDYEIGVTYYRDNPRGKIVGHRDGLVKLVFRPSDKRLLGVHIVGENAAELIHIGLTVMQFQGTIDAFIDACYNYPTLSDAYKYAAYDGLGRLLRRAPAAAS